MNVITGFMKTLGGFVVAVAMLAVPVAIGGEVKPASPFAPGEKVTMLGDSITHGGKYCANLQLFWDLRFPGSDVKIMNCGVSGGTAGGGLARWERDVLPQNADRIFVMFGMNDVGGRDFNGPVGLAAAAKYTTNMTEIAGRTLAAGKRLTIMTTTPYDEYGTNFTAAVVKDRDAVGISRLADICRDLAADRSVELIDLHRPIKKFIEKERVFSFCRKDRVHPNADGHIVVTAEILSQMGVSPYVAEVEIDAGRKKTVRSEGADVTGLAVADGSLSFDYAPSRLPFPTPPEYLRAAGAYPVSEKMNLEILKVKGLPEGKYVLSLDGKELAGFSADELSEGVNLALLPTPGAKLAMEAWSVSRRLSTAQVRLRTLVQIESLAQSKGADPGDFDSVVAKVGEYVEAFRKRNATHYFKYYGNQLKSYRNDKPREKEIREQEEHWRRKLRQAAAKKWRGTIAITPVVCTDGKRPYEFVWAKRTADEFPPVARLENADGWTVRCDNAEAVFTTAGDRALFGESVTRLKYRATGPDPRVRLIPPQPIAVPDGSDMVTLWVYGNNVFGYTDYDPPKEPVASVRILADFTDSSGTAFKHSLGYVYHKEWHLFASAVTNGAGASATLPKGSLFTGLTVTHCVNREWNSIDLTSMCIYRDPRRKNTYKPRAKRGVQVFAGQDQGLNTGDGKLPFPDRVTTVVPPPVELPCNLEFRFPQDPSDWSGLQFRYAGSRWVPLAVGGGIMPRKLPEGAKVEFRREGNSLVCDVVSPRPGIESVLFGSFGSGAEDTEFTAWPYYLLGYFHPIADPEEKGHHSRFYRPRTAMLTLGGRTLFVGATFDWTQSNASDLHYPPMSDVTNRLNSGVLYERKTDGTLNGCFERFVWTFSENVTDVLPVVPNPVSPYKHLTGSRSWGVCAAHDRAEDAAYWRAVKAAGMNHIVVNDHEVGWRDGNESNTFRTRTAPKKGGDAGQRAYARVLIDELGFLYGPYNNFTDYGPVNEHWSMRRVTRRSDNRLIPTWNRYYSPKATWAVGMCEYLAPIIQGKFGFNTAYCDVHTAVTPWSRTDFDADEPGAGTFAQVFYCYGEIMLLQKAAWGGPVYSEGGMHWLFCGLTDGNYAQDRRYNFEGNPWLVDFDLKRLHPLCCNFGMGSLEMFYGRRNDKLKKSDIDAYYDRFTAATLAFGHPGFFPVSGFNHKERDPRDLSKEKRLYFPVQAIAARYTQAEAADIRYAAADGSLHRISQALANGAAKRSQLRIVYSDGTVVAVNGNKKESFRVEVGGKIYDLPPNGWRAESADKSIVTFNGFENGERVRYAYCPEYSWRFGK